MPAEWNRGPSGPEQEKIDGLHHRSRSTCFVIQESVVEFVYLQLLYLLALVGDPGATWTPYVG